ncbi:MAG: FapA family protein [Pseudomonadota bacterium]
MKPDSDIPSLGQLALQYKTVTREQLDHAFDVLATRGRQGRVVTLKDVLIEHKVATQTQIHLLELIREFLIIRKQSEKFGQIAIEKGFATQADVDKALEKQKLEFRRAKVKRLVGDILVEAGIITAKQRDMVAREQKQLEEELSHTLDAPEFSHGASDAREANTETAVRLSVQEKQFLALKAMDQQFAISVVEKGFATEQAVDQALKKQTQMFRSISQLNLLGDIMVSEGTLTHAQKQLILEEQRRHREPILPGTETGFQAGLSLEPAEDDPENSITVRISETRMEAWVKLPEMEDQAISLADVKAALARHGVVHGTFSDALLQRLIEQRTPEFLAARGSLPFSAGTKTAQYSFPCLDRTDPGLPVQSVSVQRGETLAVLGSPGSTSPGKTVFGQAPTWTLQEPKPEEIFRCAHGARISRDGLKAFAGRSGTPFVSMDKKLYVFSLVNILEDADMKFGPVETFADLRINGTLTGAYPVKAGSIRAREIRGADIEAMDSITVTIGITGTTLRTQGSVHARYIHNSTIEAFGDVIVENEIIDSQIITSGKCNALKSRIIASTISAKQGIQAAGIGSDVTEPCLISAGREDHILTQCGRISLEIAQTLKQVETLKETTDELAEKSAALFDRMVKLKLFHDRAKQQKNRIVNEINARGQDLETPERKNTLALADDLTAKMETIIASLRELNIQKKNADREKSTVEQSMAALKPGVDKTVAALERDMRTLLEWSQTSPGTPQILIRGKVAQGTRFTGVFSSLTTDGEISHALITEKLDPGHSHAPVMTIQSQDPR